jgi:acetyltransferase-like isoleucine patch superfamily enzyme
MSRLSSWLRDKKILGSRFRPPAGVTVGRHTYGLAKEKIWFATERTPLSVGAFCSFAHGVTIMCNGNHSIDCASSYPLYALAKKKPPAGYGGRPVGVNIGNDVWVGYGVTIMSGVSIGHGAVLGAETVVAKDVPPYAVVIGNPARISRYRFSPETISQLLAIRWWDWDDDKINLEAGALNGPIEAFLEQHCLVVDQSHALTDVVATADDDLVWRRYSPSQDRWETRQMTKVEAEDANL